MERLKKILIVVLACTVFLFGITPKNVPLVSPKKAEASVILAPIIVTDLIGKAAILALIIAAAIGIGLVVTDENEFAVWDFAQRVYDAYTKAHGSIENIILDGTRIILTRQFLEILFQEAERTPQVISEFNGVPQTYSVHQLPEGLFYYSEYSFHVFQVLEGYNDHFFQMASSNYLANHPDKTNQYINEFTITVEVEPVTFHPPLVDEDYPIYTWEQYSMSLASSEESYYYGFPVNETLTYHLNDQGLLTAIDFHFVEQALEDYSRSDPDIYKLDTILFSTTDRNEQALVVKSITIPTPYNDSRPINQVKKSDIFSIPAKSDLTFLDIDQVYTPGEILSVKPGVDLKNKTVADLPSITTKTFTPSQVNYINSLALPGGVTLNPDGSIADSPAIPANPAIPGTAATPSNPSIPRSLAKPLDIPEALAGAPAIPNTSTQDEERPEEGEAPQTFWGWLYNILIAIWQGIVSIPEKTYNLLKSLFEAIVSAIQDLPSAISRAFEWARALLNNIWEAIQALPGQIAAAISNAFSWLQGLLTRIWEGIQALPSLIAGAISTTFDWLQGALSAIGTGITNVWDSIKAGAASIGNTMSDLFEKLRAILENIIKAILSLPSTLWDLLKALLENILSLLQTIANAIGSFATTIYDAIVAAMTWLFTIDQAWIQDRLVGVYSLLIKKVPIIGEVVQILKVGTNEFTGLYADFSHLGGGRYKIVDEKAPNYLKGATNIFLKGVSALFVVWFYYRKIYEFFND